MYTFNIFRFCFGVTTVSVIYVIGEQKIMGCSEMKGR